MFLFQFKLLSSKIAKVREFTGTWSEFEAKYPGALLVYVPAPVE
jgi:hypothetical protein